LRGSGAAVPSGPLLLSSGRHQRFEEFWGKIPGRQRLDEDLLLLLRQHDASMNDHRIINQSNQSVTNRSESIF
jgi:hypothetical protein